MPIDSRTSSALQLMGSGKGKMGVNLVSVLFFVILSLALLVMEKAEPKYAELLRTKVVDTAIPVIDFLARPIDTIIRVGDTFNELVAIREQNTVLRQENEKLKKGYFSALQVDVENKHLRKLLNFIGEPKASYITARVVGDTGGSFLRSAIINVGENHRVRKGQAVINDKGLVGRIIEVGERSARILLVTDLNSRIPVITSESRERGILAGDNTENPQLLYLPEDTNVEVGEMIVTSGDGDLFPSNQPIGIVYYKDKDNVIIRPFVEWSRLEYVTVVDY